MSENQNEEMDEGSSSAEKSEANTSNGESEDQLIWPRGRGRKQRRITYLNFAKVFEIFPELNTDILCKLAELRDIRPSRVRGIVPDASAVQIAAFLQLAEDTATSRKRDRRESAEILTKSEFPEEREPVSPIGSVKGSSTEDVRVHTEFKCPTDVKSEFMDRLKKLIPPEDGGNVGKSVKFSEQFETKILNLLEAAKPKDFDVEHFEQVYNKLLKDPMARSQLENLHAARAHKYGYAEFGSKFWYKESKNISRKFKSQTDRRKFRIGLKGLIDFINQLNILDLEKLLDKGDTEGFKLLKMPTAVAPETFCKYLEHVPPLKLVEFVNRQKAENIRKALEKISALAHFSQSMADYFARDDALEPALAVVCEVLRNTEDIGGLMKKRGATFLSLAKPYEKERSSEDHVMSSSRKVPKSRSQKLPCFRFQKGNCRFSNCFFKHECSNCGSHNHGSDDCRRKRKKA